MSTMIFVNLSTDDLERSKAFYTALGCEINPMFTDENAAAIVWDERILFMVLTREFFKTFTEKKIADSRSTVQAIIAFSRDSRDEIDEVLEKGIAAGGVEPRAAQDHGLMYTRSLEDPDGNILEFFFMEPVSDDQGLDSHPENQT